MTTTKMFGSTVCYQTLLECIANGANEEAKVQLKSLENPSSLVDSSKLTLLHYAAKCGNTAIAQHLIDLGCDVNAIDNSGFTPLMLAVQNANVMTVEVLLRNNANVFTERSTLQLALHHVIDSLFVLGERNYQLILEMIYETVSKLLSSHKRSIGKLLLRSSNLDKFAIVVFGNEDWVENMLRSGYPVDFQEPTRGFTALHCAIIFAQGPNVRLLMKNGASTCVVNHLGLSPLRYYTFQFEYVDKESNVLESFLTGHADLYLPDRNGSTEVEYLLKNGNEKTRKKVLEIGLHIIMAVDYFGNAYLEETARMKIAYLLLEYGLDPQQVDNRGISLIRVLYERRQNASVLLSFLDHIALIGASNESILTDLTCNTINSQPPSKNYFDFATKLLKSMRNVIIYGNVSMLMLLTEIDRKLVAYARNRTLRLIFKHMIGMESSDSEFYYWSLLRKRLQNAIDRADFEEKVSLIIQQLTGLSADVYHVIVYKIICYLDIQDLNNLCRVENIM